MKWYSDSQACVHVVQSGSGKPDLHQEAFDVFQLCFKYKIDLRIEWIPRELNQVADELSKVSSTDEWEVTKQFFEHVDGLWGPHEIDRFAYYANRKTVRYNSLFLDYDSEAVDRGQIVIIGWFPPSVWFPRQ